MSQSLTSRTRSAVIWMASGEIARQITQFLIGVVLARLLTPGDYGLIAMAMFVVGFVGVFGRTGMAEALVQRPAVSPAAWSSVYWLGLAIGCCVGLSVWVLAPLAASFFRDDRIVPLLRALGWLSFLSAIGATQRAWLAKQLRFRAIAQIEWCGILVGGMSGLALAWSGWEVWSLVVAILLGTAVPAVLFLVCCPWRPTWLLQRSEVRLSLRFGLGLQGFGIVNYLNRRLDDALIGRYLGPLALGYYERAYQLMLYPVQNIAGVVCAVMFPALAEIGDDLPRFRAAYLRAVSCIAAVAFPTMLGLLVTAPEAIDVMYGRQWAPLVPILQVLCLVGVLQAVGTTTGNIFMARARTGLMFAWGVAAAALIYPSFFIGVRWGVMGVAVAYAVANFLLIGPELAISFRLINLSISDLVRSLRGVLCGSVLMAVLVAAVRHVLLAAQLESYVVLMISVATGVLVYGTWLWATNSDAMQEVLGLVRMTATAGSRSRWHRPGREGGPGKSVPVVSHFVFPYLFPTGSWIHSQLINTTRHRPIVVTEQTQNLDTFPFSPLYAYGDLGYTRKIWIGLRAGRRRRLRSAFFTRVLRQQRARLIHAHFGQTGATLLEVRNRVGLPMVTSFYGSDATQLARDPVWRERYRGLFAEGHAFLAEGPAMRATLQALGCPTEKIIIHHLGVPLDGLPFVVRRPDTSGMVKVLIAGTFREKKGIPYALRAADLVHRRDPRLQITLMGDSAGKLGDDDEKREILAVIGRSSCPVNWIGFQPYPVFQKLLLEHHIFLSPSVTARDGDSEGGAPVSIIEAQATGMPVVSSNHADIPEVVINGESALLSPERDVEGLAKHLERLVTQPSLWESMGRRGRAHVERHHDVRLQTARLEEIYDTVLSGPVR